MGTDPTPGPEHRDTRPNHPETETQWRSWTPRRWGARGLCTHGRDGHQELPPRNCPHPPQLSISD